MCRFVSEGLLKRIPAASCPEDLPRGLSWAGAVQVMANPEPLPSRTWSCSELAKGAAFVADLSGMDLVYDPTTMSRDQLLQAIQDQHVCANSCKEIQHRQSVYTFSACKKADRKRRAGLKLLSRLLGHPEEWDVHVCSSRLVHPQHVCIYIYFMYLIYVRCTHAIQCMYTTMHVPFRHLLTKPHPRQHRRRHQCS